MPSRRRKESITGFYHIIVKGINKERIFAHNREKSYFKKIILKHLERYEVEFYCYCIMSNHAHFIIRAELHCLSSFMAMILAEYAMYYNYKHERNGHVFQNRFKSECIESEKYLLNCIRYIHMNPVKAGIVKHPQNYKYSSVNEYIEGNPSILHINAMLLKERYFNKTELFLSFHGEVCDTMVMDVLEDKKRQQEEMAIQIAETIKEENSFSLLCEVFEEKDTRKEYANEIKGILKTSDTRTQELMRIVRKKYMC